MFRLVLIAALIAVAVAGGCDNDCSGHGACLQNGVCACYDNWGMGMGLDSGDCSQRICPFEFAWVDKPDKLGNHHKYAECSNRGICDRDSGECECFPGYEGKACARTSCPNDCSGHGRCKFIEDLPFQVTPHQFDTNSFFPQKAHTFGDAYKNWDAGRTRGCHCDPEWGDVDCSKRMCQHGNDIMDQRQDLTIAQKLHVQHIQFVSDWHVPAFFSGVDPANDVYLEGRDGFRHIDGANSGNGRTFALTFTSKLNETFTTIPIRMPATDGWADMKQFFVEVEHALEALPNGVIDNVKVNGELRVSPWVSGTGLPAEWNQGYLTGDISSTSTNTMSGAGASKSYDDVLLVSDTGVGYGAKATLASDASGFISTLIISTAGKGYVAGDIVSVAAAVLDGDGNVVLTGGTNSKVTFVLTSAQIAPGLASDGGVVDSSAGIDADGALDGGESDHDSLYINITFQGANVQGPQNLLTVKHIACADGCTPKLDGLDLRFNTMNVTELIDADYNSYECGRRGKCDYGSGICSCFNGYSGLSCGTITSLV